MPISASSDDAGLFRFGVFEVNVIAGELRKNGARMRLQEQPFQVLVVLLENAGQVVTRENLRQKVWPADTFVDFDHSLNTAVNKIREALGDSATSPRFVETMAHRGYRFIAPVNDAETQAVKQPASLEGTSQIENGIDVPAPNRGLVRGLF